MGSRLKDSVARVLAPSGQVVGLAFRISEQQLLTCAHVVAAACDLPLCTATPPTVPIRLTFPAHTPKPFLARVIHWEPLRLARAVPAGAGDVAVLHVESPLPASIRIAPLCLPDDLPPALYRALGQQVGAEAAGELAWQYHEVTEAQPSGWRRSRPSQIEARHAPPLDFSGSPVWDPLARGVVGIMTTPGARLGSRDSFWLPWGALVRQWPDLLAHLQPINPYRGLAPFREEEQLFFFGREEATAALVERLQRSALLAIVGPEGSGKSSLLHAGLIPALRRDAAQRWRIGTFQPTRQPLRALAEALIGLRSAPMSEQGQRRAVEVLEAALRKRKLSLSDVVAQLQQEAPHRTRVLLAADQMESLLALDPADPERQQLLELLLDSANSDALTLLLLLQAEGLESALADVGLARALQGHSWLLPPLSKDELHRAAQAPAAARGVRIERGLIGQLVHEAAQQAHPLPAVSLLLRRLWEERSDATMWRSDYAALGGVARAIAQHAEQQYASLHEPERDAARRLFLRLLSATPEGGWEGRSVPLASLPPEEGTLVPRLARAQLLALRRLDATGATIVAPHLAVARGWPRLQAWLHDERRFLRWRAWLRSASDLGQARTRGEALLLTGAPLQEAVGWLEARGDELAAEERAFIERSVAHASAPAPRAPRARLLPLALGMLGLLVAFSLMLFLFFPRASARPLAVGGEIPSPVTEADGGLTAHGPPVSRFEGEGLSSNTQQGTPPARMTAHENPASALAFEAEGRWLAAVHGEQTLWLWDTQTANPLLFPAPGAIRRLAFSPDRHWLAASGNGGTFIWDRTNWQMRHTLAAGSQILHMVFVNGGDRLLTASREGAIALWYVPTGEQMTTEPMRYEGTPLHIALDPPGQRLAVAGQVGLRVWEIESGREVEALRQTQALHAVAFSPDGQTLAAADDAAIRLWRVPTGEPLGTLPLSERIDRLLFRADGDFLLAASASGTVLLWNRLDQSLLQRAVLGLHPDTLHFSADGAHLLAASLREDGLQSAARPSSRTVRVWEVVDGELLLDLALDGTVHRLALSDDAHWLATASGALRTGFTTQLWEIPAPQGAGLNALAPP